MFVVQSLKEALREINDKQRKQEESSENAFEELSKLLKSVTARLHDGDQVDANQGLCAELLAENIPLLLVRHVISKNNDTAIEVKNFIAALLDLRINDQQPAKHYFFSNFDVILETILSGAEASSLPGCALEILTVCVNCEEMAVLMLNLEMLRRLTQIIIKKEDNFDIAYSTQGILKNLLLTHQDLAAEFVLKNVDPFFDLYLEMIDRIPFHNIVLSRQLMRVLWGILYDRKYKQVLLKFVADAPQKYAAWTIKQLDRTNMSYKMEVWQVFKILAAYPAKSPALKKLLIHHREELLEHTRQITDRQHIEDPETDEENQFVKKRLEELTED